MDDAPDHASSSPTPHPRTHDPRLGATSTRGTLVDRIRIRVLIVVVGGVLAGIGAVSYAAAPLLPVIGVAMATTAVVVRSMVSPLGQTACRGCGADLAGHRPGEHGVTCPACGRIGPIGRFTRR